MKSARAIDEAHYSAKYIGGDLVLRAANAAEADLYRDAQPPTLSRHAEQAQAQQAEMETVLAAFKAGYARAGRPKIALLWNRMLADEISSTREVTGALSSSGLLPQDNYEVSIRLATKSGPPKRYSLAPPSRAAEFEAGFQAAMREGGVVFVDRETIVRLSALEKTKAGEQAKDLDFQTLEMSALAGYAQYFAEINFIRDAAAQGGFEVRATVIGTASGEVIADVVPAHLYKSSADQGIWKATDSGFAKQPIGSETHWYADENGFHKSVRAGRGPSCRVCAHGADGAAVPLAPARASDPVRNDAVTIDMLSLPSGGWREPSRSKQES